MKKIVSLILSAVLMLLCAPCAFAEGEEKNAVYPPQSMLVLGDSISTGFRLYSYSAGNNYNTESYANLLAKELHLTQEKSYKNLSIDGQTSDELLKKIQNGEYDNELSADLIVLTIGGNDLLGEFLTFLKESIGLDLINVDGGFISADFTNPELMAKLNELMNTINENIAGFSKNFSKILSATHEKNENAYLILQTVYDPLECLPIPDTVKNMLDEKIKLLNNTLNRCVELETDKSGDFIGVVDVYSAFKGDTDDLTNMLDGDIHPSVAGHKRIYEEMLKVVNAHSFCEPTSESLATTESKAEQADAALTNVNRKELGGVLILSLFAAVFGICVFIAIIIFIKRKKSGK